MSNGLSSSNVVELLKKEWQNIQKQLGPGWDDFVETYCKIVNKLPDKPKIEDVERAVDQVCELLCKYKYTRGLLHSLQDQPTERMLPSACKILENAEQIDQISNTLRSLAGQLNKPASRSQKAKEGESKR